MIKTRTLFILGAGASKAFGYPTGIELRKRICSKSKNTIIAKAFSSTYEDELCCHKSVDKFVSEFSKSGVFSIDSFLEHRPEFMEFGKMAIASYLLPCENDDKLRDFGKNWYMYLFDRINASFEDFDKNTISFITFNYDRTLEQFLFEALKYRFNKKDQECAERINKIRIVHLYGQLDFLPWQDKSGSAYGIYENSAQYITCIRKAVANIKLIKDGRNIKNSEEFKTAYSLIKNAQKIYFLGFSFDPTNLERLNIGLMANKTIKSTSLSLELSKEKWVSRCFRQIKGSIYFFDVDVLTLLKDHLEYE